MLAAVGQSGATAFPPPLWGRDRERGTTALPLYISAIFICAIHKCRQMQRAVVLESVHEASLALGASWPPLSPTRGEGTVGHAPSQLTQCVRGCTSEDM